MRRHFKWLAVALAFALVAAACGGDDSSGDDTTTTTAAATTTTAGPTTTVAPDPGFEGAILDSGGCDYGGKINTVTAMDEFTVQFDLCSPDPAFLAKLAFSVLRHPAGRAPGSHRWRTPAQPGRNRPVLTRRVGGR